MGQTGERETATSGLVWEASFPPETLFCTEISECVGRTGKKDPARASGPFQENSLPVGQWPSYATQ